MKKKIRYNLEALKKNLERCDKNITLFQEAIQKEYDNKVELQRLIDEIEEES